MRNIVHVHGLQVANSDMNQKTNNDKKCWQIRYTAQHTSCVAVCEAIMTPAIKSMNLNICVHVPNDY